MISPKHRHALLPWLVIWAGACGSGHVKGDSQFKAAMEPGTRPPAGPGEEAVLARLEEGVAPDEAVQLPEHQVQISPSYNAASGRLCRRVVGQNGPSLVCEMDLGWAFVPNVLGTGDAT